MLSAALVLVAIPAFAQSSKPGATPGAEPAVISGEDGFAAPGYEGVPEPVVVQGDLAIYEPAILMDKQHQNRQFLSVVVENRGNRLQRLTSAKIDGLPSVRPVVAVWQENDVQLIPIDQIAVNARETVSVGPDSLALQIDASKLSLKEGDKYKVTISFEPAGTVSFQAPVNDVGSVSVIDQTGGVIEGGLAPGLGRPE